MHRLTWPALVLATLGFVASAQAQRNALAPGPAMTRRLPELPPTASGVAWPRLDVGAIFCRTQEDLRRRSELMATRASGGGASGAAPDCRIIAAPTAVDVVDRPLPSATQVRLKLRPSPGAASAQVGETGWTDAWLPEKAPR